MARAYFGPYAASKAALEALVRTYAAEVGQTNVRANLFSPGPTRTRMMATAFPGVDPETLPTPETVAESDRAAVPAELHGKRQALCFPCREVPGFSSAGLTTSVMAGLDPAISLRDALCPITRDHRVTALRAGPVMTTKLMLSLRPALERIRFLAQRQADRRARQVESLAQRIHQIALVGVGHRVGAGAEQRRSSAAALWPA